MIVTNFAWIAFTIWRLIQDRVFLAWRDAMKKHLYVQENFKWKLVTILTNVTMLSVINKMVKITNEADTACLALPRNGGIFSWMLWFWQLSQREQRTCEAKINVKCMLKVKRLSRAARNAGFVSIKIISSPALMVLASPSHTFLDLGGDRVSWLRTWQHIDHGQGSNADRSIWSSIPSFIQPVKEFFCFFWVFFRTGLGTDV